MADKAAEDALQANTTREFIAGTLGGFVGKIVEFPMDTVCFPCPLNKLGEPNTHRITSCRH
jgi:hypothetical protein